jgi:hypothetical protein
MATRLNLWWFISYLFILLVFLLIGLYKFLGGPSIYPLDNAVEIISDLQEIENHISHFDSSEEFKEEEPNYRKHVTSTGPSAPIL